MHYPSSSYPQPSYMQHEPQYSYYHYPQYPTHETTSSHYPSYYPQPENSYYQHQSYYPQHSYSQHQQQQQQQQQQHGYGYPSYQHGGESGGMASVASLLIPLLGLIGLSLLVPNVVGLRAKRDADYDPSDKQAQALMTIYTAVLSSDDCVKKLLCEMGQLARNAKDKQGLFKLIDRMAPKQFHQELSILKESSLASSYTCKKYTCHMTAPNKLTNVRLKT